MTSAKGAEMSEQRSSADSAHSTSVREASSPQATPELTATCQKLLPGGIVDDATYAEIEDALDRAEAPSIVGGRWLKLHERIAALTAERTAASAEPQSQAVSVPSDDAINSYLKNAGEWVEPFTAERECGVAIECDMSQEDADYINAEARDKIREIFIALSRPLRPDEPAISLHQRSQGE